MAERTGRQRPAERRISFRGRARGMACAYWSSRFERRSPSHCEETKRGRCRDGNLPRGGPCWDQGEHKDRQTTRRRRGSKAFPPRLGGLDIARVRAPVFHGSKGWPESSGADGNRLPAPAAPLRTPTTRRHAPEDDWFLSFAAPDGAAPETRTPPGHFPPRSTLSVMARKTSPSCSNSLSSACHQASHVRPAARNATTRQATIISIWKNRIS